MMEVDGRVVMSNAATVRRLYTRGNNEALLRQFFPTPPLLYCGHVWMTGDSHYFSEEEDDMPQALWSWGQQKWYNFVAAGRILLWQRGSILLWRCNVTHKPDLRTANYAPEFPPICRLL
jgi:hypothetical protein